MLPDDKDKKILNILLDNSRLSYRQIAKKLKLSVATVMHRINALEKGKIIRKYSAALDYDKLGYDICVMVMLKISKGRLFDVEKKIANNDCISAVYDITGDFDAIVLAKFHTRRQMDSFLKKIQKYDFVERTKTMLVLNTIKEKNVKL